MYRDGILVGAGLLRMENGRLMSLSHYGCGWLRLGVTVRAGVGLVVTPRKSMGDVRCHIAYEGLVMPFLSFTSVDQNFFLSSHVSPVHSFFSTLDSPLALPHSFLACLLLYSCFPQQSHMTIFHFFSSS